jgi:hypothetical protein
LGTLQGCEDKANVVNVSNAYHPADGVAYNWPLAPVQTNPTLLKAHMELHMYKKNVVDLSLIKCGVLVDTSNSPAILIGSGADHPTLKVLHCYMCAGVQSYVLPHVPLMVMVWTTD